MLTYLYTLRSFTFRFISLILNGNQYNLSDEGVCESWVENPYWQYFCGYDFFQWELPLDPSSLSRWRGRLGKERLEQILKLTVKAGVDTGTVTTKDMKEVTVDTTVTQQSSSRKTLKQRRIEDILEKLSNSDTLIVTELSRLGRSTAEVIELFNELVKRSIRVIAIKQSLDVTKQDINSKATITLFSELERDLISARTKEALAIKKLQGQVLGKLSGTIQRSKFDKDIGKIKELLKLGLSVRKISKFFGYNNHISLNTYISRRNLRSDL